MTWTPGARVSEAVHRWSIALRKRLAETSMRLADAMPEPMWRPLNDSPAELEREFRTTYPGIDRNIVQGILLGIYGNQITVPLLRQSCLDSNVSPRELIAGGVVWLYGAAMERSLASLSADECLSKLGQPLDPDLLPATVRPRPTAAGLSREVVFFPGDASGASRRGRRRTRPA